MNDEQIKNLNKLLGALDTKAMSSEEIIKSFEMIIEYVKKNHLATLEGLKELARLRDEMMTQAKSDNRADLEQLKGQVMEYCKSQLTVMLAQHDTKMAEVDAKMDTVLDGQDADEERVIQLATEAVLAKIPPPQELEPETGDTIIEKVNESEEQINRERVKGLDDLEKNFTNQINSIPRGGGNARGFQLYVGGTKKGIAQYINLVAGSNVTITDSLVGGLHTITVASTGGSGFSQLAATETPNSVIKVFTFAGASAKPSFLVVDGVWMQATTALGTTNWTWNNSTHKATLTIPANEDIYGVV